ncbi:MAG: threonine--tRNA ligase [bacterium]|nr:threonine--tRNA ligase [bacterium]
MKNYSQLEKMRHSTAHLLAAAVLELWPDTKLGIGPVIEDGFYYDFDFEKAITESDLEKIEKKMLDIKKRNLNFTRAEKTVTEAIKFNEKISQPYKVELTKELKDKGEKKVSFYETGNFIDLCEGPHLENSKQIGSFKLTSLAGAYWRGNEKNKQLTRVYGTVWTDDKELKAYLTRLQEAKKRDHRLLGKELGLFVNSDLVGKGLPMLTGKGATLRRVLERFIVDEEIKRGYEHVLTPPLAKVELYKTSGHYPYYKETMYPVMKVDEEELILRPMTCPHHFMLYKAGLRSYRDLPLRLAEISPQFRYEKSGELSGLMRVRTFTLSDAHIFVAPEGAKNEIKKVLDLIDFVNSTLGLEKGKDYRYRLSLGDRGEESKYFKDDVAWEKAEKTLREVLQETKAPFFEAENEAAFYGPKIDVQIKNVLGKEETAFTVQYDFVMPRRFNLEYIDEKGKAQQPIVIHRSSVGALERTMAFLIEHYGGDFPLWLAPIQVELIPIAERHLEYAEKVKGHLQDSSLRVEVNSKNETMQAKIREAELQKIPYLFVLGDREQAQQTVSVRSKGSKELKVLTISEAATQLQKEVSERK